jgi:hypothetical protein
MHGPIFSAAIAALAALAADVNKSTDDLKAVIGPQYKSGTVRMFHQSNYN